MPYKDIEKRKQWAHEYIRRTDVKIRRSAMKNKKYAENEEYREKIKKTAREWQRKKRLLEKEESRNSGCKGIESPDSSIITGFVI